MKNQNVENGVNQKGFSLMEMMVVLIIITIVSAIAISYAYSGASEVGGGERVLEEVSARIVERRAEAVRMNGDDRRARLQEFEVAPLPIDFSDLSKTASLRTEGTDTDRDCVDDVTQKPITCLNISGNQAEWSLAFNDDALSLPTGWQILAKRNRYNVIPTIGDGSNGRGVQVSAIAFDATGKAQAKEIGSDQWVNMPTGAVQSDTPSANEAPFWAIYFYVPGGGGILNQQPPKALVAVAVHPSGLVERFRYDDGEWIGFNNRVVK